jgi:poly-gamma-glutamate synthesis protein (capsule biosynthesis protein)
MTKLLLTVTIVCVIFFSGFLVYKKTHPTTFLSGNVQIPQLFPSPSPSLPPTPTLNSIFTPDHSWTKKLDPEKTVTLIATGDVIPARTVNFTAISKKDFAWSYKNIAGLTKSGDLTFINLETPLIEKCPATSEGMIFCGDPRHIQGLLMLGADIANLGNNHAGNYGETGVKETITLLNKNNIDATGINGPIYKSVKGVKFAFLGYDDITTPQPGVSNFDETKLKHEINEAQKNADIVIVQYHWGVEYRAQPDDRQKKLGHLTIDDGADLVIGNHPHWIQPIEFYNGKLITYAHGNTIFDQMWSEETKYGVIGKYTFYNKQLVDVEYFPLYIKDYGQPSLLDGPDKQKVLDNMKKQSEILASSSAKHS